jgi:hypothetical protein
MWTWQEMKGRELNLALLEDDMSTEPPLKVVSVERIDGTDIIVEFSDSTCATYTPQELAAMWPNRRRLVSQDNGDQKY